MSIALFRLSCFNIPIEIPISIYSEISKSINKVSNRIYKKEKLIHKAYDDRNIILNSIEFIGIINMLKSDPYDKWWIHMDDDDWFWITILGVSGVTVEYSEYYKCDSKSGLYELLKYKNVIN